MSAPNINNVTLVGQLTADPELRSLPDGRSVCDLRLAVNDRRDQVATFVDVSASAMKPTPAPSTSARAARSA